MIVLKLDGVPQLRRTIQRSSALATSRCRTLVKSSAAAVADRARTLAPMATGRLRRAIQHDAQGLSASVLIGAEAPYWRFVEYGTVRMAAQPFLRPSAEQEAQTLDGRLRDVGQTLERDWGT